MMSRIVLFILILFSSAHSFEMAEVKVHVAPSDLEALGLSRGEGEQRTVYFFDDPQLSLYSQGIILRARVKPGKKSDSTVKVRPFVDYEALPEWEQYTGFKAEVDVMGERMVETCSITRKASKKMIRALSHEESLLHSVVGLFEEPQLAFALNYLEIPIDLNRLMLFGPITTWVWKKKGKTITIEYWELEGGGDMLEISTKVPLEQMEQGEEALARYLRKWGVHPINGGSKTGSALRSFL